MAGATFLFGLSGLYMLGQVWGSWWINEYRRYR